MSHALPGPMPGARRARGGLQGPPPKPNMRMGNPSTRRGRQPASNAHRPCPSLQACQGRQQRAGGPAGAQSSSGAWLWAAATPHLGHAAHCAGPHGVWRSERGRKSRRGGAESALAALHTGWLGGRLQGLLPLVPGYCARAGRANGGCQLSAGCMCSNSDRRQQAQRGRRAAAAPHPAPLMPAT